jgi:hypothetical protein
MKSQPQPQIPVIFVNAFSGVRLAQMLLPAVPVPTDDIHLGELAYEVFNTRWVLCPNGQVEILVRLWPQENVDEKRPFQYPEENDLWEQWLNVPEMEV